MRPILFLVLMLMSSVLVAQERDFSAAKIYARHCNLCHMQGLAGAPKPDDVRAWSKRLDKGVDALTHTVLKGSGAMPPKGSCFFCSDDEIRQVVDFMLTQISVD